jgi:hypothetical protein
MMSFLRAIALACCLAVVPAAAQAQNKPKTTTKPAAATKSSAKPKSAAKAPARAPLFNLGTWTHPVTTTSPDAQKYFDQGLLLCYGFNHAQAITSFQQAAALDSTLAMAQWGIALAYGPNINMPMDSTAEVPAWEALQKALALSPGASDAERDYIQALANATPAPGRASGPDACRDKGDSPVATDAKLRRGQAPPRLGRGHPVCRGDDRSSTPWNGLVRFDGRASARNRENRLATLARRLHLSGPNDPGANHY